MLFSRLRYTELYEIHSLFRGLELFLPISNVNLLSGIQPIEVLFREMKFDPRTNELLKRSGKQRLGFSDTYVCIFRFISH